jgi:LuxR family transcriptional regulator, maltose regulon positive regulatory protein
MATDILAIKLRIPPEPHHQLRRPSLVEELERNVPLYRVTSVSAPAGYGKTTLLAQWARMSRVPVAWVSLSEDDNDLERLLRSLVTAWAEVHPPIRESEVSVRLGAMAPDIDAVLSAFINVGTEIPDHTVFVLDDVHLMGDGAIHRVMTFLLDHLPPQLHMVLAGRGTVPVPLARYRARGELLEYHADDLRFGVDEARAFLNEVMALELGSDEVATLHTQLEGWPAGLQLAALALRRSSEGARPVTISGRHRFIADYLLDDVLARLPADVHRFLLQTSILDRLSAALCDAVTGRDDSQKMLESLERDNLFIVPLDETRDWYRYHRLFAEVLHQELLRQEPGETAALHRRAARWYLDARSPEPAFQHALAADDDQTGFAIFDRYANVLLNTGQFRILQQWLDQLPSVWRNRYPVFGLAEAGLLLFSGAFAAGLARIDEVEQRLKASASADGPEQQGRVTAVRCFVACMQNDLARAERLADQALRELAGEDLGFRPGIFAALGDTYRRHGRWADANASYLTAMEFTHAPMVRMQAAHIFGALADLELRQGRLRSAGAYWEQALVAVQDREHWGQLPLPVFGWVELRLGELLYEWNELDRARAHVERGLERAELGGDVPSLLAGSVICARLKLTEGDRTGAAASLERARPYLEPTVFPDWTSRFERCQVDLWLAQDQLRSAVHWADTMLAEGTLEARPESEPARLALARVLILKGDASSLNRASALLDQVREAAEPDGRVGVQIEALTLGALAQQQRGDRVAAMPALEHALRLAEPEGYVRLFVDLGLPMARLLQEARSRDVMPDYVVALLAAFSADPGSAAGGEGTLPEPLSEREHEVLQRLAAGLTNREIADEFYISAETVKKHTGSIYGKLGVHRRTEAVTRARELDLLE